MDELGGLYISTLETEPSQEGHIDGVEVDAVQEKVKFALDTEAAGRCTVFFNATEALPKTPVLLVLLAAVPAMP